MERILVIAPQYIGDSILAIPFLRELKKHYGRYEIDVITKNAGCLVFKNCEYIANIYDYKTLNLIELKNRNYIKAYLLKRSLSAAILAFILGIKERIGFGGQCREILLTKTIKYEKDEKHELEHFFDILKADYIEINSTKTEYSLLDSADTTIKKMLSNKKNALIVASASTPVKNWKKEYFAQVADYLIEKGYNIYFTGLPSEREYYFELSGLIKETINTNNLCGKLSFDESMALIGNMNIVIGIDSGYCHVAAALGIKTLTLFGPMSVKQWAPKGDDTHLIKSDYYCVPCKKPKKCKIDYKCMKMIKPELVISKLEEIL